MYVAVKQNEILEAFDTEPLAAIQAKYPGCQIIESDFAVVESEARSLLRMYGERIVTKVAAIITTNKNEVRANGYDEVRVKVTLQDLQSGEVIPDVVVDIDGATLPCVIGSDNIGEIIFSTKVKGLHIITVEDNNIHCCPKVVVAK